MTYDDFKNKIEDMDFYCELWNYEWVYIRHSMGGEYGSFSIIDEGAIDTDHNQFCKMWLSDRRDILELIVKISLTPIDERGEIKGVIKHRKI